MQLPWTATAPDGVARPRAAAPTCPPSSWTAEQPDQLPSAAAAPSPTSAAWTWPPTGCWPCLYNGVLIPAASTGGARTRKRVTPAALLRRISPASPLSALRAALWQRSCASLLILRPTGRRSWRPWTGSWQDGCGGRALPADPQGRSPWSPAGAKDLRQETAAAKFWEVPSMSEHITLEELFAFVYDGSTGPEAMSPGRPGQRPSAPPAPPARTTCRALLDLRESAQRPGHRRRHGPARRGGPPAGGRRLVPPADPGRRPAAAAGRRPLRRLRLRPPHPRGGPLARPGVRAYWAGWWTTRTAATSLLVRDGVTHRPAGRGGGPLPPPHGGAPAGRTAPPPPSRRWSCEAARRGPRNSARRGGRLL